MAYSHQVYLKASSVIKVNFRRYR